MTIVIKKREYNKDNFLFRNYYHKSYKWWQRCGIISKKNSEVLLLLRGRYTSRTSYLQGGLEDYPALPNSSRLAWTNYRGVSDIINSDTSTESSADSDILESRLFITAPMSRAQSPTREQTLTLAILADRMIQMMDTITELKNKMESITVEHYNPTRLQQPSEMTPETFESGTVEAPIKNYNKAMPLIPDFDGSNVETFINHIQIASKRLAVDQHELFLCGIVAQKLVGRAKHSIRTDTTPNFPQLYEKLRYLYGKARNLSALEVQRDTCIQRTNESIDEFINRFLRIQDDIIHTVNSQSTGIATICLQEQMYQQKAVEVFRRNVKTEISDHLYSFEFTQLNEAFSKARAFEAELQLRKLRTQRYETSKKPFQPRTHFQTKECTYCKRRGHEEKECRTKVFHQQRGQQNFRERQSFNRPPDRASHHLRATDQDPDENLSERYTKDPEGRTSELPELS